MAYLTLRAHFDNLAAPAPRVRDRQQRSDLPPGSHLLPRRGVPLRATPRSFFRWLRASASLAGRSQRSSFRALVGTPSASARMSFASSSPKQRTASGEDALTYRDALDALARVHERVTATT